MNNTGHAYIQKLLRQNATDPIIMFLYKAGYTKAEIGRLTGLSRMTIYAALQRLKEETSEENS